MSALPSTKDRRGTAGLLFATPFLVLFVVLFLAPLAYAAYLSLFQTKLVGGTKFVGLDNYARAVADPLLLQGVLRVATFFLIQVPVMLLLALLFALALDSGLMRLARVVRLGIFVPYAVPSVVATLMWGYLYGPDYGPFAQLSRAVDLPVPRFLSEGWMLGSLANVVVVRGRPDRNISDTRNVEMVIRKGQILDREKLKLDLSLDPGFRVSTRVNR